MINTVGVPSAPIKEDIIYQKIGDLELPEDEEDDGDYSPSDVDSDDSLEWASETERTMLEDALAEGNVGINYADAAVSMTTEYLPASSQCRWDLVLLQFFLFSLCRELLELPRGLVPRTLRWSPVALLPC